MPFGRAGIPEEQKFLNDIFFTQSSSKVNCTCLSLIFRYLSFYIYYGLIENRLDYVSSCEKPPANQRFAWLELCVNGIFACWVTGKIGGL